MSSGHLRPGKTTADSFMAVGGGAASAHPMTASFGRPGGALPRLPEESAPSSLSSQQVRSGHAPAASATEVGCYCWLTDVLAASGADPGPM